MPTMNIWGVGNHWRGFPNFAFSSFVLFREPGNGPASTLWARLDSGPETGEFISITSDYQDADELSERYRKLERDLSAVDLSDSPGVAPMRTGRFTISGNRYENFLDKELDSELLDFNAYLGIPSGTIATASRILFRLF